MEILSRIVEHQEIDASLQDVAGFVGAEVGLKISGADLFDFGEFVDEKVESLKDGVEPLFFFRIVDHLRKEPSLGDGGLELVHDRPQQQLSGTKQIPDRLDRLVEGVGHFGDFIPSVTSAADVQISLGETDDFGLEFAQGSDGADDPEIEKAQENQSADEREGELQGEPGFVHVFQDQFETIVVDENVTMKPYVDHGEPFVFSLGSTEFLKQ